MRRTTWLIVLLDVYGIAVAVLAFTGVFRPPITIIPFVITTPLLTSQFRRVHTDPRYRSFLFLSAGIFVLTWIALFYSVFSYLT